MSEERDPELEIVYMETDVSDPVGLAKERAEEIIRDTYPFAFGALFDLPPGAQVRMGWRDVDGNVHWGQVIRGDDTHLPVSPKPIPEQPKPSPTTKPKRKG